MLQFAAMERGQNFDELLANQLQQRDLDRANRNSRRLEAEMMEQAQLRQVMEESKQEALRNGQVANPDNLTYEVSERVFIGIIGADRESR